MKTLNNIKNAFLKSFFLCVGLILTGTLFAQDAKDVNLDVTVGSKGDGLMTNWWMWLVGLAIFVIIIVAIVSASRRKD